MRSRTTRRELWALILLAAAVRLPWLLFQPTDPATIRAQLPDQAEYLEIAHNLLSDQSLHFHDPRFHDSVFAFRMPGYPLFIAALGGQPTLVRLMQVAIDCSTVVAVWLLARRWIGLHEGRVPLYLLAGAAVALNPWLIYFSSLLLSETLFTAMLAWGMVLLSLRWPGRRWGLIGGMALLALSVYVRPSALPLPALMGMAAVLANRPESRPYHQNRRFIFREAAMMAALGAAMTGVFLLPWGVRNHLHPNVHTWIWTTTNAGFTAFDGFQPAATGASDQTFVATMPELQAMHEVERSRYLSERAAAAMREDPGRTASLALRKIARTWSPLPLSAQYGSLRYVLPGVLYSIPFFILVLIGVWTAPLARTAKLLLLLPAIYLTLIHALSVGSARYRIPAEAPMAVLAAAALARRPRTTDA